MADQKICIIGGAGFVGRHLAHRLTREGWRVTIPTRRRERQRALLVDPRVTLVEADVNDPATLRGLLAGCAAVINLVGILNERRGPAGEAFARAHVELPGKLVAAMHDTGVRRLLHMSALNADPHEEHSLYLRTKGQGEDLVHGAARQGLEVTSFRPSVIFGPGDSFFNRFATLLRITPLVFPLACADSRFAPVYVDDVIEAMVRTLRDRSTAGRRCDLCGPEVYTLAQLVEYTARQLDLRRSIWKLTDGLSRLQARALEFVPGKPFSRDNYWSLQQASVCDHNALIELGIRPTAIDAVVPGYLGQRSARDAYPRLREQARRG